MKIDLQGAFIKQNVDAPDICVLNYATNVNESLREEMGRNVSEKRENVPKMQKSLELVLHVADDVAQACRFLEVEAGRRFFHLAFEVGKLCR